MNEFKRQISALFSPAIDALWPRVCVACERPSPADFCSVCALTLVPGAGASCPHCGLVWLDPPPGGGAHHCGPCLRDPPNWGRAFSAFAYGAALRDAIARWKNRPDPSRSAALGDLLVGALGPLGLSALSQPLIIPVPSSRPALRRRGFSPAGHLARSAAGALSWTVATGGLTLLKTPPPSKGRSRTLRLARLRGVFQAHPKVVAGREILLIDDVMTTGATAGAATTALLKAGAASVNVLVLARVQPPL